MTPYELTEIGLHFAMLLVTAIGAWNAWRARVRARGADDHIQEVQVTINGRLEQLIDHAQEVAIARHELDAIRNQLEPSQGDQPS